MTGIKERVLALSAGFEQEIIALRRHLHRYPELSTLESATSGFIQERLSEWGIPFKSGYSGTGVVGLVTGRNPGKRCIALRADMDALPIQEETGLEFSSCKPGVMHACGHDVHMACLLGAARILKAMEDAWEGTVKLIFQPSEEDFRAGAPVMIRQGVLRDPVPDRIYALHVLPELDCGKIGWKAGPYMASTDELYLRVLGKGGHAATPERNVDAVVIAAYVVTALQQIVSRQAPPYVPTVLSFGRISGQGRTNIIPGEVEMEGTLRTFDEQWRAEAHERIARCAEHVALSMGGRCELRIEHGYPFLSNNEAAARRVEETAVELLGADHVEQLPLRMTAEDFAYYAREIPACMFRLGVRPPGLEQPSNLHTGKLMIDERAIRTGMQMLAMLGIGG